MDLNLIDHSILNDCIRGKREAEYKLYQLTHSYLMSICIRYTRNEEKAREMLNLGFHRILSKLSKFRQHEVPFKSWVRVVMINTLINEFNKEKSHRETIRYVNEYMEDGDYSVVNEAVKQLDIKEIYKLIARLPDMNQRIFNLYYIDGYKQREIAELLDINENTCKWYLTVAKEKLKDMILTSDILINHTNNERAR